MTERNEIIQIGAVKLDCDKEIIGRFSEVIKPESITEMNKTVSRLTGITDEVIASGKPFAEVMEKFRDWCGEAFVFLIWGYYDIRILKSNMSFHGLDLSWLPAYYNIQMIFCEQNNMERRQYSLAYALEFCGIELDAELHDAMNDAEYTALVCRKLDLEKGIEALSKLPSVTSSDADKSSSLVLKRKFRGLGRKEQIWENGMISRPLCPLCAQKMTFEKARSSGNSRYNIKAHCPNDGDFALVIRFSLTPTGTYSVCQQIFELNETTEKMFEKKNKRPFKRRRARRKKSASAADSGAK